MLWVLWDIVLPLMAAFLVGLLVGWLLWRWRRSRIDADGLSKLRRTSGRYKADVERLQQSNLELSERLQAIGGNESGSARKRIDPRTEELKPSRRELTRDSYAAEVDQDVQAELAHARSRIIELESSAEQAAAQVINDGVSINPDDSDLRAEIAARDRMITTLEKSLQQYGESGDATALLADIAIRDRKIDELEAVVATFNHRM